jgi:glyoxylase-like metal-dependent hydrolase (beta-lactamase superfamily II)
MDRWRCVVATHAPLTRFGEVPAYQEGLYDLGGRLYAWMVPNGSWGESNAGLVLGDGEALLVDTQWDLPHTRAMLDAMATVLAGMPLKHVINTHGDGDHFWGNQLLTSAEILASQGAFEEMQGLAPRSMALLGVLGRVLGLARLFGADKVGHWFRAMVAPYDFRGISLTLPQRKFSGEMTLQVGGRTVRLIEVGPAHTQGDVLVYLPEARVLYSGDIVFVGSTPVIWAGPVESCIAALDRILGMDVDVIVPGHGPITDKAGVRQVKAYWEFVVDQTRRRHEGGMSAGAAARDIALSREFAAQPFAGWNSPERMMINTHTLYRHYAGRKAPPSTVERLGIMRKQAALAHELPDAQPRVMRKRP